MGSSSKSYSLDQLANLAIDQWNKKIASDSDKKSRILNADIQGLELISTAVSESISDEYANWLVNEIKHAIHNDLSRVMLMGSISSCLAILDQNNTPKELRGLSTSETFYLLYKDALQILKSAPLTNIEDGINRPELSNTDETADKAVQYLLKSFDRITDKYSDALLTERFEKLIGKYPELQNGFLFWFLLMMYATAKISDPPEEHINQPTNLMTLLIVNKYPINESTKAMELIGENLPRLGEISQTGDINDWGELFITCLNAYFDNPDLRINNASTGLDNNKLNDVQNNVVEEFLLLWERVNISLGIQA